jgi:tetratricopeptide (TPR) repeat protein
MIKEKKNSKYNLKKTKTQVVKEYTRTILISVLFATIVTSFMAMHARSEMIKNLYIDSDAQYKLDKNLAQQIVAQSDLISGLKTKSYAVCLNVGDIYEAAGDYKNAQIAYELAVEKSKPSTYLAYYKLVCVLVEQEKFDKVYELLDNLKDYNNKKIIKFKTRAYLVIGDKFYSIGKFLSAGKNYENAEFYYSKFVKKDSVVENSIINRIVNSYIQAGDIMVKSGLNTDAVRFLKKAEKYAPEDLKIKYKLAIVLSDSDPERAVEYLEPLLDKIPQEIDCSVYNNALAKSANIADFDNRPTKAKYYRYKIHSIDMFVNRKVVYKNDIETRLKNSSIKKTIFSYPVKAEYIFTNVSNADIVNLFAEFVLLNDDKPVETITTSVSSKEKPLYSNGYNSADILIKFRKIILSKKELENYSIKIYLYKDEQYKTLVAETKLSSLINKSE